MMSAYRPCHLRHGGCMGPSR
uniref:Uncharacterized protein n=1 Tax=Anguilla anguilla TaxID=7936 RepID=A0A0E9VWE1_ANGAN